MNNIPKQLRIKVKQTEKKKFIAEFMLNTLPAAFHVNIN